MKDTIEVQMKNLDILVIGPPKSGKTTMCKTFELLQKLPADQSMHYQSTFSRQSKDL